MKKICNLTRMVKIRYPARILWLLLISSVFIMGKCGGDKDEISTEEYWADKSYDLSWDSKVWSNGGYVFTGSVWECEIGDIHAVGKIFLQEDDGDWSAEGTFSQIAPLAPLTSDPNLTRSFQMTLNGKITSYEDGSTCALTMKVTVDYKVNVENNTGTMVWSNTRIDEILIACEDAPLVTHSYRLPLFTADMVMKGDRKHCQ
jgi:hypothetical protein